MILVPLIVGGALDAAHPAVVAILDAEGRSYCTGTLIAPDLVLTAAHCFDTTVRPVGVGFGAGAEQLVPATRVRIHPDYDPATFSADVALLWLDVAVDVPPAPLLDAPMSASWVGARVRVVGYGLTGASDVGSSGVRRWVDVPLEEIEAERFRYGVATCGGDSGGPAFLSIGGIDVLAGVTSSGPPGCLGYGRSVRVDAVRGWIESEAAGLPPTISGGCASVPGGRGRGGGMVLIAALLALTLPRRHVAAARSLPPSLPGA
jgi:secreted trypsin-like serine protease